MTVVRAGTGPRGRATDAVDRWQPMRVRALALVSNALDPPPDEGTKKFAQELARRFGEDGATVWPIDGGSSLATRKLLLDGRMAARLRRDRIEAVIYVPTQSSTPGSVIRAAALRRLTGAKVVLVALQPRNLSRGWRVVHRLGPHLLLTSSSRVLDQARQAGFQAEILELGVDTNRFVPVGDARKKELRQKYELAADRPIALHVGHANRSRGTALLARLGEAISRVVVVGRSLGIDPAVVRELRSSGVRVIDTYLPNVEEIYQAADVYVFPVQDDGSAIATPLSVLEAMACNLPIVTTRFGALPRMFPDGHNGLVYVDSEPDLVAALPHTLAMKRDAIRTRELVLAFDWAATADGIVRRALELCRAN